MNSITLNEQQMNLLREYLETDAKFQAAKAAMDGADFMSKDFDRAANDYSRTLNNRMNAASVFAASVAAGIQPITQSGNNAITQFPKEVANG
jgi:hypothetical protein